MERWRDSTLAPWTSARTARTSPRAPTGGHVRSAMQRAPAQSTEGQSDGVSKCDPFADPVTLPICALCRGSARALWWSRRPKGDAEAFGQHLAQRQRARPRPRRSSVCSSGRARASKTNSRGRHFAMTESSGEFKMPLRRHMALNFEIQVRGTQQHSGHQWILMQPRRFERSGRKRRRESARREWRARTT